MQGDRSPDRMQRLLNRASSDELAVMSQVRRFEADGLAEAARRGGLVIAAIDERTRPSSAELHGNRQARADRAHGRTPPQLGLRT